MSGLRIFPHAEPEGEQPASIAEHLKAGGEVLIYGVPHVATDPDSIRTGPRDDFTICAHGHDGSRIGACEREAAEEFCARHGGADFDPLAEFLPDPDAEFERLRARKEWRDRA